MDWFKRNSLKLIGYAFLWLAPLTYILVFAIQFSQHTITRRLAIEFWAILALFILIMVYVGKINKMIKEKVLVYKIRENRVPALWRVIQMFQYIMSMAIGILIVDVINQMGNSIFSFLLVIGISGVIGYLFLIVDSASRTPTPPTI